jgi:hypothetical protein
MQAAGRFDALRVAAQPEDKKQLQPPPGNRRRKPKGQGMKRTINTQLKAIATLALACSTALVFAVASVQARPTHNAAPRAATTAALSTCKIIISATPWRIRAAGGNLAGNRYTLAAKGISCSAARTWVTKFTHQQDTAQIKGPSGFTCRSFSTAASGDKRLYSGACMHAPHNIPFFEWAPKMPRS